MSPVIPTLLFWSAAIAIVVGQVMILRSTARAWGTSESAVPFVEKIFAWGPTLVLAAVLWFSWKAASAPPVVEFNAPTATAPAQGVQL